jgi:predicted nucleic acid-binding protein
MMLDTGALIAVDRNDRAVFARLLAAEHDGDELRTHPMVVAQVWRDPRGRQSVLARLLRAVEVVPIDDALGRRSGELLGATGTSDPIDAAVVLIARDGEAVMTGDPADLRRLAQAAGRSAIIVTC